MSHGRYVEFLNPQGQLLRGILHEPDPRLERHICVLLLSPGIKGRVGPHRLYLKLAARLVPLGFHVLRFDYFGLGDSSGEIGENELAEVYAAIQSGRYVDDTVAAMNWAQEVLGISRFVGSGLCGGSISALLTAAQDPRIECLLGIGLPTALDGRPENRARSLTQRQLDDFRDGYKRKLLDPRSWLRLVSGKTDYAALWRSLRGRRARSGTEVSKTESPPSDNTNPRFAPAFRAVIESGRQMLLIFSANDRMHYEFQEKFEARHPEIASVRDGMYETVVIEKANHVMSDRASVGVFLDHADRWLTTRYGPPRQV
jgi:pimeloyl-ACP methyl ester carboxylesterase